MSSPPFALSTMYFQRWPDESDLAPFFAAGRELGFTAFELSHILAPGTVERIRPGDVIITAVHHPCPRPAEHRPGDEFSAPDAASRGRAADQLAASIDTAARLGASAVVLHLGRVGDRSGAIRRLKFELVSRYQAGHTGQDRYGPVRDALAEAIAAEEGAALDGAIQALAGPVGLARESGVKIGIETGYHPEELPTPAGMRRLLDALPADAVGAWLDTGHVGAQVNLGLVTWDDWWAAARGRWLGAHYHDLVGLRDHLVPGAGSLDFAALAGAVGPGALATLEVDWYFGPDEVAAGALALREALAKGAQVPP